MLLCAGHTIASFLSEMKLISPPTYRRGTIVLRPVRSSVRPFVWIFLRGHPLKLSEILHEVVTSDRLKSDILRFLKKISLGP